MKIEDIEFDEEFLMVFSKFGTQLSTCNCGREHVCIDSYVFHTYTTEEMQELNQEIKTNKNLVVHNNVDHVLVMHIAGRNIVEECECKGWKPYMDFILNYRSEIRDFLVKVTDKYQRALEHEKTFNILKNKKFKSLDDPLF